MPDPTTHVERYTRAWQAAAFDRITGSVPDYAMLNELFVLAVREVMDDEVSRLRAALLFYAADDTYTARGHPQIDADTKPILADRGSRARAALQADCPAARAEDEGPRS